MLTLSPSWTGGKLSLKGNKKFVFRDILDLASHINLFLDKRLQALVYLPEGEDRKKAARRIHNKYVSKLSCSISLLSSVMGSPRGSDGKESTCNTSDPGLIHGSGRPPTPKPEKKMATHSSILAWNFPWTEEPGRLQSMGSHRVGHDWVTNTLYLCNGISMITEIMATFDH